ncbi:hypothetical protein LEP1GSC151_3120 [Leptospira interrogans serovar Grippotyphosa str. LT2186]|uniref:Uncharacterized protein n=1 Tax=Leptospira interrogans serovar Grippotyphosa str. LT2186 TaxID=1001599 RepID=M3GR00_LEPIR|nr:hypothetical protein LEP1GSC151_3120 [Leptospira interrogans serovar Grippotyphosa str. LT2186]
MANTIQLKIYFIEVFSAFYLKFQNPNFLKFSKKSKIFRIQLRFTNLITFPEIATILYFIREV